MRIIITAIAAVLAGITTASAQQKPAVDTAKIDTEIAKAFAAAPAEWKPRLDQDETMKECSAAENSPTSIQLGLEFLSIPPQDASDVQSSKLARDPANVGYLLPFEIVSVHLLVVLIGAAYLARAKRRRVTTS